VTEWWYGRGGDISGGIAVADVLGLFAREGVYAATMWNLSDPNAPSYGGSRTAAINTGFQLAHTVRFDKAEVYQITGGVGSCTGPTRQADIPVTLKNAFTIALPALSISTVVLKGSQERLVPPANLRIEP
jgi:hypothetical protein